MKKRRKKTYTESVYFAVNEPLVHSAPVYDIKCVIFYRLLGAIAHFAHIISKISIFTEPNFFEFIDIVLLGHTNTHSHTHTYTTHDQDVQKQ